MLRQRQRGGARGVRPEPAGVALDEDASTEREQVLLDALTGSDADVADVDAADTAQDIGGTDAPGPDAAADVTEDASVDVVPDAEQVRDKVRHGSGGVQCAVSVVSDDEYRAVSTHSVRHRHAHRLLLEPLRAETVTTGTDRSVHTASGIDTPIDCCSSRCALKQYVQVTSR